MLFSCFPLGCGNFALFRIVYTPFSVLSQKTRSLNTAHATRIYCSLTTLYCLLFYPECAMKLFLLFAGILIVVIGLIADYRWKQWMASRKRDRFH
jgi:hypothetical protein